MSGGSWDYVYSDFNDVADRLEDESAPERRALGARVRLLATAMREVELVDSSDKSPGDEILAIHAALGENSILEVIDICLKDARELVKAAQELEKELKKEDS